MSRETPYLTSDPVTTDNKQIVCTMYLHVCSTGKDPMMWITLCSRMWIHSTLPHKIDESPLPPPLSAIQCSVQCPVSANFSRPMFNNELSEAGAAWGNKQVSALAHIWPLATSLAPWYRNYVSQPGKQSGPVLTRAGHEPSRSFHNIELPLFHTFY